MCLKLFQDVFRRDKAGRRDLEAERERLDDAEAATGRRRRRRGWKTLFKLLLSYY